MNKKDRYMKLYFICSLDCLTGAAAQDILTEMFIFVIKSSFAAPHVKENLSILSDRQIAQAAN